jgi:hypothetical protein
MPFITQGPEGEQAPYGARKTNWKFLLIIIILAVIVGIWCLSRKGISLIDIIDPYNEQNYLRFQKRVCKTNFVSWCEGCRSADWPDTIEEPLFPVYLTRTSCMKKFFNIDFPKTIYCSWAQKYCEDFGVSEKDETTDWKTYRNEEYEFEIKYPNDWSTADIAYYDRESTKLHIYFAKFIMPSLEKPDNPNQDQIKNNEAGGIYLSVDESSMEDFLRDIKFEELKKAGGLVEETVLASEKGYKVSAPVDDGGGTFIFIQKNSYIYSFLAEYEYDEKFLSPMLSTFRFIEEIKTGKVEISYEEITKIQQSVDEGHQPWRLDPIMVAMSEASLYGFTEDDIKTIYAPHIDSQWVLGRDITAFPVEITHQGEKYELMVIQPFKGEGKIWTISDVELEQFLFTKFT